MTTANFVMFILLWAGRVFVEVQVKPIFLRALPPIRFWVGVQDEISERKRFCLFHACSFARVRPTYTSRE